MIDAERPWPADRVERRPVDGLVGYARNARLHSEAQIEQIAASVREFGWTVPVLVDEAGVLIAGHGRVLAARQLGLRDVPVMVAAGWSDAQVKAYRLLDNRVPLSSTWDSGLLQIELGELRDMGFDLALTGFDPGELEALDLGADLSAGDRDGPAPRTGNLADRFGVPPFSVLNAREGWWQERKRAWLALGIESELGRGDVMPSGANSVYSGSSQWSGKRGPTTAGGGGGSPTRSPAGPAGAP